MGIFRFFKNLLGIRSEKMKQETHIKPRDTPQSTNSFTIIDMPVDELTLIYSYIDEALLKKINKKQEIAIKYEKLSNDNTECCICFELHNKFVPLECAHEICTTCYFTIIKKFPNCPICQKSMKMTTINKLFAIIVKIDGGLAILYLPPLYNELTMAKINYEIFYEFNDKEKTKFLSSLININKENYAVVLSSPELINILMMLTNKIGSDSRPTDRETIKLNIIDL